MICPKHEELRLRNWIQIDGCTCVTNVHTLPHPILPHPKIQPLYDKSSLKFVVCKHRSSQPYYQDFAPRRWIKKSYVGHVFRHAARNTLTCSASKVITEPILHPSRRASACHRRMHREKNCRVRASNREDRRSKGFGSTLLFTLNDGMPSVLSTRNGTIECLGHSLYPVVSPLIFF